MASLYPYLKWLHVIGAIAALGANLTYPIWMRMARKDRSMTRFAVDGIERVEKIANAGYATLLITGIAMVLLANMAWTTPWLLSGLILLGVVILIVIVLYVPAQKKQNALVDNPANPEYLAAEDKVARVGFVVILLVVAIEFLMTVKPALW